MTNNYQGGSFADPRARALSMPLDGVAGYKAPLVLGIMGAGVTALFVAVHWSIAVAAALAVLALAAMESEAFLLFVIFLMPFAWLVHGHNVLLAMHAVVVVGFFAGRMFRGEARLQHLLRPTVSKASLLFVAALAVPLLILKGKLTIDSARAVYELATYVGFYFVILAWVDSRPRVRKATRALLLTTILTALFAIYQQIIRGFSAFWLVLMPPGDVIASWTGRSPSFMGHPNQLAFYLGLVLPFALAYCVLSRGKWKKVCRWTLALGLLALLSTQSVGGIAAFVAILVLAIWCFVQSVTRKIALLAGLCALVCLLYALNPILNPSHTAANVGPDVVMRLMLWDTAWGYFLHFPWFGVGWGNFVRLYGPDLATFSESLPPGVFEVHNIYLQMLAETGVVGFVAFIYLIYGSWGQARRQFRSSRDVFDRALAFGVLGALLSLLVHGFIDVPFVAQFGTLLWVLLALLVANGRVQRPCVPSAARAAGAGA